MSQVLLLIDREERRRRLVSIGLSEFSYEVVPALDAAEGLRYARTLAAQVIVAVDQAVAADRTTLEALFDHARASRAQLVLLDTGLAGSQLGEIPDHVLPLTVTELLEDEVVERLRMLLLGRQLNLETDLELQSLVGDFAQLPAYSLLPRLSEAGLSGRLQASDGAIDLLRGEIWSAKAGEMRGLKAFCRLGSSWSDVLFDLVRVIPGGAREIAEPFSDLLNLSVE
jgi:hypothetical protein